MSSGEALASAWPLERAGEVIEALARRAGLSSCEVAIPLAPSDANGEGLDRWIQIAAGNQSAALAEQRLQPVGQ